MAWVNRIVGHDDVNPKELVSNDLNWRTHPKAQQDALAGTLDDLGIIDDVIVNKRTSDEWKDQKGVPTIVDGHLRVRLAIKNGEKTIPVKYVDLTPRQENLALATIDPIAALATTDTEALKQLIRNTNATDARVLKFIEEMTEKEGLIKKAYEGYDQSEELKSNYQLLVKCENEQQQLELIEEFTERGLHCRALIL